MDKEVNDSICNYLEKKSYPGKCTKNDKRRLREKAGSFLVTSGELFHKGKDNKVARVIVDDEEKIRVIRQLHEGVGGGHFGQKQRTASVRDFVRKCDACQKANPQNKPPPAELHPVKVSHIFHRWGINFVGASVRMP